MKKIILSTLFFLISTSAIAQQYLLLPIVEVYDGDTIKSNLTWRLPPPLNKISIRILGINAPEMPAKSYAITGKLGRAKCIKEAEMAIKARDFVRRLAKGHTRMKVENFKYGKWAGRILADVKIGGVDVGKALINKGLAVYYHGTGLKYDWCR